MNFPLVPLSDVTTVIAGQSPPGHTYNDNGVGLPFFQGKTDFGEVHPIARKWCTAPKKIAERGDILISVRAPVGPTNVADSRCCIGRGLAAIRPDGTAALRDFVLWSLRHRETKLVAMGQGSTFAAISQKNLKSLQIPLPPLDEQRRIVGILNRAARIERLRKQARERMREFVPALFVKMFGDPADNQRGWKIEPLGNLCNLAQYGTSKKANDRAEGMPLLRMGNVTYDGYLDCAELKHVLLPSADIAKYELRVGDIVFNRTNSKDLVGKTGLWDGRYPAVAASYFIRLRLDESRVSPTFLWAFMNSAYMKRRFFNIARGAIGQANINAKELKSLLLPIPPIETQRRFTTLVSQAYAVATSTKVAENSAKEISAALISRLLGAST